MSQENKGTQELDTRHQNPAMSEELANHSPTSRQAGNPFFAKIYEMKDAIFGRKEMTVDFKNRPMLEDKMPHKPEISPSSLMGSNERYESPR